MGGEEGRLAGRANAGERGEASVPGAELSSRASSFLVVSRRKKHRGKVASPTRPPVLDCTGVVQGTRSLEIKADCHLVQLVKLARRAMARTVVVRGENCLDDKNDEDEEEILRVELVAMEDIARQCRRNFPHYTHCKESRD